MEAYYIDCQGDVCTGDQIKFEENVFEGSRSKPKVAGTRFIYATVLKESYGVDKQQHTFTLLVEKSEGYEALQVGKKTWRKGRNIYRLGTKRRKWNDEALRGVILKEKYGRGKVARQQVAERRDGLKT